MLLSNISEHLNREVDYKCSRKFSCVISDASQMASYLIGMAGALVFSEKGFLCVLIRHDMEFGCPTFAPLTVQLCD